MSLSSETNSPDAMLRASSRDSQWVFPRRPSRGRGRPDDGYSTGVFAVTGKAMLPTDIQQLLRPSAYPHTAGDIRLRETHVSWVILTGDFSYKLKKPIKLEFLDMTSLSHRHLLCQEELRLNRRLAPDLYLDVVTVTRDEQGLRIGGPGPIVDYAVKMRQFDASEELPSLLGRDEVSCAEIAELAERLARFHEKAARAAPIVEFDYPRQLRRSVLGNLATLIAHRPAGANVPELGHLSDWTHDEMHDLLPVFAQRQADGFVRECHGDLHAANIVRWQGRLTPFDCLEFDPNLRFIDVMSDIAFLYMDLKSYRRQDLAAQLLSGYRRPPVIMPGCTRWPSMGSIGRWSAPWSMRSAPSSGRRERARSPSGSCSGCEPRWNSPVRRGPPSTSCTGCRGQGNPG